MSKQTRLPLRSSVLALALAASGNAFAQAIDIDVVAPERDGRIVFQRIGPKEVGGVDQGRVVLKMTLRNTTLQPVRITKVEVLGQLASNFPAPVEVLPGQSFTFHNCRCNQPEKEGEPKVAASYPAIIDAPFPSAATISVFLEGSRFPVTETVALASYTNDDGPLNFPAKPSDLKLNEAWSTSSDHAGFSQGYALDMGVAGWNEESEKFSGFYPGVEGNQARHLRVYGQPVYAMAAGDVCRALNDHPEWVNYPRVDEKIEPAPVAPSTGEYSGGGNHVVVRTGGEVALYAHLQPGSIPPELLLPGAVVQRGQYLGKVGYSGSSTGPHLHVHVSQEDPNAPCNGISDRPRPMQFKDVQSLTRGEADALAKVDDMDPLAWADLTNHSAPHPGSLMLPGTGNFTFDKDASDNTQFLGVWRSSSEIELRVNLDSWSALVAKRNDLAKSDFRLLETDTYVENGKRRYTGLFRLGNGAQQGLSLLKGWVAFETHRDQLEAQGYRLADVTAWHDGVSDNFIGSFLPGTGDQQTINTSNWIAFAATTASFAAQGLRLVDVETYANGGGVRQYVGVFRPGTGTQELVRSPSWTQFKLDWSARSALGMRLTDVDTVVVDGVRQYIGVFRQGSGGHALELHTGWQRFFQGAERINATGMRLVDVHALQ